MAQTPTLTKWHDYLQQRSTLYIHPPFLEMQVLLGPVKDIEAPDAPSPVLLADPAAYKGGTKKTLFDT